MHGVICETTKYATSTAGICDFVDFFTDISTGLGSFRFNPNQFNTKSEIKCLQQVKSGFEVKGHFRAVLVYRPRQTLHQ